MNEPATVEELERRDRLVFQFGPLFEMYKPEFLWFESYAKSFFISVFRIQRQESLILSSVLAS